MNKVYQKPHVKHISLLKHDADKPMAEEISKRNVFVKRNRTRKNSRTRRKMYIIDDSSRYVNAEA